MSGAPKIWLDMTPEEKGALLLAHHEGKTIQVRPAGRLLWVDVQKPDWLDFCAYRVGAGRVEILVSDDGITHAQSGVGNWKATRRIIFCLSEDGPDCASIRMERLP